MRALSPGRNAVERDKDPVIRVLPFSAKKLFSDGEKLYAVGSRDGNDGVIFDVFDGNPIASRPKGIDDVVSHNGEWYDGGFYDNIHASFSNRSIPAPYHVRGMHSHEGNLYAWGINGLYNALTGEKLSDNIRIKAMATIPASLLETEIEGLDPKEQLLKWAKNLSSKLKSLLPDKKDDIPKHRLN